MAVCVPTPTLTLFATATSTTIITTSTVTVQTQPDGEYLSNSVSTLEVLFLCSLLVGFFFQDWY